MPQGCDRTGKVTRSERSALSLTWVIGGGLTGCAGFFRTLQGTLAVTMGWVLLLLVFAAVILGGIGSIYGAMVGGVILGLVGRSRSRIPQFRRLRRSLSCRHAARASSGLFSGRTTA